jgi:hypothetical protein
VELACVAVGARQARRYVLYVSGTQAQADDHVGNVGAMLESSGVARYYPALSERSITKYGQSKGWRRNRLRTQAGLTVDALGLDVAARGVKLDEQRPDMIVFDDVDDAADSQETVRKKIVAITQKILPAGSPDVVVLAVQNLVHYESVFARLAGVASEPADFLADRVVSGPLPALRGFQVEKQPDGKWLIISGDPVWDGQDREVCQRQIHDWGIKAFRSEAQHERTPPEGQAFPEWSPDVHVCEPFAIPESWPRMRAVDYGYAVPYTCLWGARSPAGRIYVYRETYETRMTAPQQAYQVRVLSAGERYFTSVGDPAMWAEQREGQRYQSVAAQYAEIGIGLVKATNNRLSGWTRVHSALEWTEQSPPILQVFNTCPNLIRTLPLLTLDANKPEDVDCWVAGTPVSTPSGPVPIEDVKVGDVIDTPLGPKTVLQSYFSGLSETVTVTLSDGRVLEGTPDHQIGIEGKGLVPLESLVCYDTPIGRNTWSRWLNIAVSSIAAMRVASTTTRMAACWRPAAPVFIDRYGSMLDGKSLLTGIFTTSMATMTTTTSQTSSASHRVDTASTITIAESTAISERVSQLGAPVQKARRYSARMHGRCWSACRYGNVRADIAELLSRLSRVVSGSARCLAESKRAIGKYVPLAPFAGRSSGQSGTTGSRSKPAHIVAVGRSEDRKPVYSIGVADAHLFYANGVLSSNTLQEDHSADALRYMLQAMPWLEQTRGRQTRRMSVRTGAIR